MVNDKTRIFVIGSIVAALSGSDAIRVFYAGAVCDDGSVWMDVLSLLQNEQDGSNMGIWRVGVAVPAHIQDCIGENGLERD